MSNHNQEHLQAQKDQFIQNLIDELVNCLDWEVKYYTCCDLHSQHRKIEIVYNKYKK